MDNASQNVMLSICIPTYNRAKFIGETIQSVISQASENVEIVIVDGASSDNTAEVMSEFKKSFSNIRYYRGERKLGVDRDMAKTIELSCGEYCWMLSDDDILQPGAIGKILYEIKAGYEIYLCNAGAYTASLEPMHERYWLRRNVKDGVFNLHEKQDFVEYCNKANSIGALFSYMSAIILRREEWNRLGYIYEFDGSAYALAASLLSFRKRKCRVKYLKDPLIKCRMGNDSFSSQGLVKRFLIDFNGYLKLADKYFANDMQERNAFLKVMIRTHPWYTIVNAASFIDKIEDWNEFKEKLFSFGYNPKLITFCYALSRHKQLVARAVKIKRKLVNKTPFINHY